MSTPLMLSIKITYPGSPTNDPSFFDLQVQGASIFGSAIYDAWCVDADVNIDLYGPSGGPWTVTLPATMYSTYELGSISTAFPTLQLPGNLDEVNWLLNQHYTSSAYSGLYSSDDVQAAIWTLLGDSSFVATQLPGANSVKVSNLVSLANGHDGFVPDVTDSDPTNDEVAVLLAPFKDTNGNGVQNPGEASQQPIIIQVKSAALGDFVWEDSNANGLQDAGESGIAGVLVKLVRDSNNNGSVEASEVLATTTTDASGKYAFKGLTPGLDYQVQFFTPSGFDATSPRQAAGGTAANNSDGLVSDIVVLSAGEYNQTIDSGFYKYVSVGNYVWNDANNDGIQNDGSTAGIGNVKLNLTGTTGNGVAVSLTTTTAADGSYLFANLAPGTYQVAVDASNFSGAGALVGYVASPTGMGADTALDSNATPTGTTPVLLLSGSNDLTLDFGYNNPPPPTASLGDRLWMDTNGDGQQNDGATGISGQTVTLIGGGTDGLISTAGDNTMATTTTGADGVYQFTGLTPGAEYQVQFSKPAGAVFTAQNSGNDLTDSDADLVTGKTPIVTLAPNEHNATLDAGIYMPASLGDRVWEDNNGNGVQDDGENGIAGVTVNLRDCVTHAVLATTTTDVNGLYNFSGLKPGQYDVVFTSPAGYIFTKRDVSANALDSADSDASSAGITGCYTLNSGDANTTVDAGLIRTASLGDRLWVDVNGDGQQNDGATGLSGHTITLIGGGADGLISTAGDNTLATTTTGIDGHYQFTGLTPGVEYQVQFSKPAGTVYTTANAGSDLTDSDANVATGMSQIITLASGENNTTLDAGVISNPGIDIEKYVQGRYLVEGMGGGEGLTAVFWKAHSIYGPAPLAGWPETGYGPNDSYESIFGVAVPGTPTLLDALNTGGGGIDALMRHSTAALLNAANPYVSYAYTKTQIIAMVQAAVASGNYETTKDLFAAQNELGADLNTLASGASTWIDTPLYDADLLTDPHPVIPIGGQAIFTYVVKNTGSVALEDVNVTDNRLSALTFVGGDSDLDNMLDTTETWTYTASETVVAGGTYANIGTATGVDTISGQLVRDSDAANYTAPPLTASLGDRVWEDKNANGVQDAGEVGMTGVTVQLKNTGGTVIATQLTDVNGNYLFDVVPGTYSVAIVAPAGYVVSPKDQGGNDHTDSDIDPTSKTTAPVVITAGEQNLSLDAGLYRTASLGDRVWCDTNKNGVQDTGEAGVKGVKVTLLNAAGVAVGSPLVTDANGNYLFTGLKPGTYSVQFDKVTLPAGYGFATKDAVAATDATDSDADPTTGKTIQTVLDSGEVDRTWDAGIVANPVVPKASIGDRVWCDTNFNGIQDTGEAGVSGVTVKLLNSAGTVLSTTTTDSNGKYLFANLNSGDYKVQVVKPANYFYTKSNIGANDGIDSDVAETGITALTNLAAGENDLTWDAGLYKKASIGDRVWEDKDHDGIQDVGEAGIGGVKVMLQNSSGTTIATTSTNASGNYSFTNLDPGAYRLVFDKTKTVYKNIAMTKWFWAAKDIGGNDAVDADAYSTSHVATTAYTTLTSGENDMTWDAGITPIVIDLNGDGIHTVSRENTLGSFDLLGTGTPIESGWLSGNDGFLAVDRDGNGRIDGMSELFGGNAKGAGFAKLASYDSNGDGLVNANDAGFADLRIWRDADGNHQTDAGELQTLQQAGVSSLTVAYDELPFLDASGNLHLERSNATLADGSSVDMTDVYFNVSATDVAAAGIELPSLADLMADSSLDGLLAGSSSAASSETFTPGVDFDPSVLDAMRQLTHLYDQAAVHA
jgi:serine-aspartate repeat-containing protein C/D/E